MVRKKIANHQAVAHGPTTLERIELVRAGKELTGHYQVFGAAYRVLDPSKPAPTVTRSGFRDFVHPTEDRVCTVRELARLQSFPDTYVFKGRRCDTYAKSRYVQQTQHEQVGNAVPPLLAQHVARAIRRQLLDGKARGSKRVTRFEKIFHLLDSAYPVSDLGNKKDPLDELIYILLSRRTREDQYQNAYLGLRKRYRPWKKVLSANARDLRAALRPIGLFNQRATALRGILRAIAADFGRVTLAPLRRRTYSEAYNFLRSLPGVNDKTAKCVMLYSLGMPALPVDAHTYRVSLRLGLLPKGTSLFKAPRLLEAVVPRDQRGRFHVLAVMHGRSVCTPRDPACHHCVLQGSCPTGRGVLKT